MRYHNRIYDVPAGLSYTGLVEITALIWLLAHSGPAHGSYAPIFKGRCASDSPD